MSHRDTQTGQYNETYPLEVFVDAIHHLGGDVGTKDVEHAVGCEYRTAIAKLHDLEEKGIASSRRVGNAYLWTLADSDAMDNRSVDREPSTDTSPPEDREGSSRGTGPYDPTDEFK